MEESKIIQMQKEIKHLQEANRVLQEEKQQLKKSLEFNRNYIEMAAKLKAIEYIVRSEDRFIEKEILSAVLEISLPKKDDNCADDCTDNDCDSDDWEV